MKTVTQEQIAKYNEIRKTSGDKVAQETLRADMDALGFNSTERMHAWNALKAQSYQEQKDAVAAEKAAKKAEKSAKPSIKKTCEQIIAKSALFNQREISFLNDIKNCRKLSVKQNSWLLALADKASVKINGSFDIKEQPKTTISFEDYCEEFLDLHVCLMSDKEKAEAYAQWKA